MNRFAPPLLTLCLVFLGIGCDSVSSPHLVGQPFVGDEIAGFAVNDYLNGVWVGPEESGVVMQLHYTGEGKLHGAAVKYQGDKFEMEEAQIAVLSVHEEALYLNLVDQEQPEEGYQFLRLLPADADAFVLLIPDVSYYAQAVEQQRIPGEVSDDSGVTAVKLAGTKEQFDALIRKAEVGTQFSLEQVLLFRRVASNPQ